MTDNTNKSVFRDPKSGETELDYLDACLSDPAVSALYPDIDQRYDYVVKRWQDHVKTNKYDPNQPRDHDGQWAHGGSTSGGESVKYVTNRRGKDVEVLVNPKPNTLEQLARDVRADPSAGNELLRVLHMRDGTVYAFNAFDGTHDEIANALGRSSSAIVDRHFIKGVTGEGGSTIYSGLAQTIKWLRGEGRRKDMGEPDHKLTLTGQITKLSEERRIAYGWFSVIELDGKPVVDLQGDVIDENTLLDAVHAFMRESQAGKIQHGGPRAATVLESIVLTKDVQTALGINLNKVGWFGGMEFSDPALWQKVKAGNFTGFSIGGYANKVDADG